MVTILNILPDGVESQDTFTPEEYEQFRQRFIEAMEKADETMPRSIRFQADPIPYWMRS